MVNSLAPIALFVYNRLEHTQKTVAALQKNTLAKESELFIFSDHAKSEAPIEKLDQVRAVRDYIKTISGFKKVEIIERNENWGLAKSIMAGVTELTNKFGKVIVLEDDIVSSPYFLEYVNEALDLYENDLEVVSVSGYIFPVKETLPETFFMKCANCWGWATWKRGWAIFEPNGQKLLKELREKNLTREFSFDHSYHYVEMLERQIVGINNSWAIRWYASAFLANKLTLYPGTSLVNNIGQDGSGTHGNQTSAYSTKVSNRKINIKKLKEIESQLGRYAVTNYFKSLKPKIWQKIIRKADKILYNGSQ